MCGNTLSVNFKRVSLAHMHHISDLPTFIYGQAVSRSCTTASHTNSETAPTVCQKGSASHSDKDRHVQIAICEQREASFLRFHVAHKWQPIRREACRLLHSFTSRPFLFYVLCSRYSPYHSSAGLAASDIFRKGTSCVANAKLGIMDAFQKIFLYVPCI